MTPRPSIEDIEHANDSMPSPNDPNWIFGLPYKSVKKYYYEYSGYHGSFQIAAFKDGTFAVEGGGGCGWYHVKTWDEAKALRGTFYRRSVMLNRALGG